MQEKTFFIACAFSMKDKNTHLVIILIYIDQKVFD